MRYLLKIALLWPLCGSLLAADSRSPMLDAMKAMSDAMSDYVDNSGIQAVTPGKVLDKHYSEEFSDLFILYRNMPGAPPRSAASRTQLLDGVWLGRNGEVLMIRDGYVRLFAYSYAHYEDAEIYLKPPLLQLRNLSSGQMREYQYAYKSGRLVMRGDDGNTLLYRRLDMQRLLPKPPKH